MILADLTIDGKTRKVLHARAEEWLLLCARPHHGRIYFRRQVRQTRDLGHGPRQERAIRSKPKGARFGTEPVTISPGAGGAHNWQPMSFSPLTGLVYIPMQESPWTYSPDPDFKFAPGYWNTGMQMGRRPPGPDGKPAANPPRSAPAAKEPEGAENQPKVSGGFLVAWDPVAERHDGGNADGGSFGGGGTLATGRQPRIPRQRSRTMPRPETSSGKWISAAAA